MRLLALRPPRFAPGESSRCSVAAATGSHQAPEDGAGGCAVCDVVILTSDNPRTEDPAAILREVEARVKDALENRGHVRYQMLADRRAAIKPPFVRQEGRGHGADRRGRTRRLSNRGTTKHFDDDQEVAREMIRHARS